MPTSTTVVEQTIDKVHDWLVKRGPTTTYSTYDLSVKIGVDVDHLRQALSVVRSPQHIDSEGWTIPFVSRGMAPKLWLIAGSPEFVEIDEGLDVYGPQVVKMVARVAAHAMLAASGVDKRSAKGKYLAAMASTFEAMRQQGELVYS